MWARRRGVFQERATDITIYLLELPAENVCWNCHIIYRFGLRKNAFGEPKKHRHRQGLLKSPNITTFRAAGTSFPGSLDIFISLRTAPEDHVWSR